MDEDFVDGQGTGCALPLEKEVFTMMANIGNRPACFVLLTKSSQHDTCSDAYLAFTTLAIWL